MWCAFAICQEQFFSTWIHKLCKTVFWWSVVSPAHPSHTVGLGCAYLSGAHPGSPRSLYTWGRGWVLWTMQSCRCFLWAKLPNHFHVLSSSLSCHVPKPCHDSQLHHCELASTKLLVSYPPDPFSFSLTALYFRQSFWHVHLISLWQEYGSMDELWINSKSLKLEIGTALLSTVLVSWLPQWLKESEGRIYKLCFFFTSVNVNLVYASKWSGFPNNTPSFCKFSFSMLMSNSFHSCAWLLFSIISTSFVFHRTSVQ